MYPPDVVRMGNPIGGILAFSHAGRKDLSTAPAGMDGLARATLEELEPSMKGRGVKAGLGTLPPARDGAAMPHQVTCDHAATSLCVSRNDTLFLRRVSSRDTK
jgi:hypothetical protein